MTKIKICGINKPEDVVACNKHMPDYIGLVFCESVRQVNIGLAQELSAKLNREKIKIVGVFRNNSIDEITTAQNAAKLDVVQLHGDENAEFVKNLREIGDFEIVKAMTIADLESKIIDFEIVDGVLIDGINPGSGESFNWNEAAKILQKIDKPIWLAGGLNPKNVKRAIEIVKPAVVDVSSGVDSKRGIKSEKLIGEFVREVRE